MQFRAPATRGTGHGTGQTVDWLIEVPPRQGAPPILRWRSSLNPTPAGSLARSPGPPPQGLLGFAPVGGEGDFGGLTGNWK
jgi:hypothetical protein